MGGLKCPVIIAKNIDLNCLGGIVRVENPSLFGVKLGFGNVDIFSDKSDRGAFVNRGTIIFKGRCNIGKGAKVCCSNSGILEFGDGFVNTAKMTVICSKRITFGKDDLISWNVTIMDTDTHKIKTKDQETNEPAEIKIGNHVWIGCDTMILKGAVVSTDSVISAKCLLTKRHMQPGVIIAGQDKIVKESIEWEI
jgi:acetyltransferase-like isoleucine patch superfamily enzyme